MACRDRVALDLGGTPSPGRIGSRRVQRCSGHPLTWLRWQSLPGSRGGAGGAAVVEGLYPVEWAGGQAVVALPEHIGISNAGQVREELLSVINQGATTLIADMTATISCDHAGADAVTRAWQRAASSGTELRLVVTAQIVALLLSLSGLDRLVSVYPSLEAATGARMPAAVASLSAARARRAGQPPPGFAAAAPPDGNGAAPAPAGELLDALQDAVALADADGTVVAASARMDAMFGYTSGELRGLSAESLVPDGLQPAHRDHRAAYMRSPETRPMGAGRGLTGLRKDGSTFPVWISLTPVTTAAGQFTLAVIRDAADARLAAGVAALARDAAAARQEHLKLLDTVITDMFHAGLSLQTAVNLPADAPRQHIEEALADLDDIICQIRDAVFADRHKPVPPRPAPPVDNR
jgi:anti-anti-sigma factor